MDGQEWFQDQSHLMVGVGYHDEDPSHPMNNAAHWRAAVWGGGNHTPDVQWFNDEQDCDLNADGYIGVLIYRMTPGGMHWSGPMTTNTTWSGSIYVEGDVTVQSGVTLTIQPSTTVRFAANTDGQGGGVHSQRCELIVNGTLNVNGNQANPVTFISSAASSQKGDWYGIRFLSGSSGNIQYANIYYTIKGIYCNSASPTIQNCIIPQFSEQGIYCYSASPTIQTNNIRYGGSTGIYVYGSSSSPQINNQNQINNCSVGIEVKASSPTINSNYLGQQGGVTQGIKLNTYRTFNITNNYISIPVKGILVVTAPSVDIRNNEITGITGIEASGSVDVYNNNIFYSDCGVWVNSGANPKLDGGNNLENNDMNVINYSSYTIDAENNWWGTTVPNEIEAKIQGMWILPPIGHHQIPTPARAEPLPNQ